MMVDRLESFICVFFLIRVVGCTITRSKFATSLISIKPRGLRIDIGVLDEKHYCGLPFRLIG